MAIKKRENKSAEADSLANELADKPYGEPVPSTGRLVRTSLSLPSTMHDHLEDMAIKNKRAGRGLKTVSAIVREAIENYIENKT